MPEALVDDAACAAPGKRERNKAANRAAILVAAGEAFVELGYGATGVRDIVRRSGLAPGTFYNYFPDKESAFRALVEESATEARARVRAARARATSLEQFVAGGYRAYFEFIAADRATFELMRRNAGTIRTLFDEWPALGAGVEELRVDLDAAVAAGAIPPHDTEYMAAAMVGAGFEIAVRMVDRGVPDVEAATAFATALFVGGAERVARAPGVAEA